MTCLIYIHIGKKLPEYIYDSIYQTTLVSNNTKIYVLLDDSLIESFNQTIYKFNSDIYTVTKTNNLIECIPLSILKLPEEYSNFINNLPEQIKNFRDLFWIYTIARFFYVEYFMSLFKIKSAFHIENDVMIYEDLNIIENTLDSNKVYMVKDSDLPSRVIASIMYINNLELKNILKNMLKQLNNDLNLNDMQLLGNYNSEYVEYFPFNNNNNNSNYIFDGAAIGQYLGGIDPRNIKNENKDEISNDLLIFDNPSRKFINETCTFKLNDLNLKIFQRSVSINNFIIPLNLYYITNNQINIKQIVNTHIHSKQLYEFSSVFNLKYADIITGDRIISLCDFVITTDDIYNYHKNIERFINLENIIKVKNFNNIDINTLNNILHEKNKKNVKIFVYTHLLEKFVDNILHKLSNKLNYIIYLHNSDHQLENNIYFKKLLDCKHVKKVYSQNINCDFYSDKFCLLPIGLANSMFNHGDVMALYKTMRKNYLFNKTKNLYININPNTFEYRKVVLEQVDNPRFNTTKQSKPFNEYLEELSTHYFSLCVRGNGIDTHRLFESYYLGVIPVIINNKHTNMENNIKYMKSLGLPFYEITSDTFEKYSDDFFNEKLYKRIIKEAGSSIFNLPQLKLSYYTDTDIDTML